LKPFVIGTRGSDLALAQATLTEAALRAAHPELELERQIIHSSGDLRPDIPLAEFTTGADPVLDKGIFTKELEIALAHGRIDCAVHSLKDVPTVLPEGFALAAYLPRAPIEEVLLVRSPIEELRGLHDLPEGAVVGTGSVRRVRQVQHLHPGLQTLDMRGNVPTRVRKLLDPDEGLDAILLARAGLERLGQDPSSGKVTFDFVTAQCVVLRANLFMPAFSQGAVGIEIREGDDRARGILAGIDDPACRLRVSAERRFLDLMKAGCHTPVAAHTELAADAFHMKVRVYSEDDPTAEPIEADGSSAPTAEDSLALASRLYEEVNASSS